MENNSKKKSGGGKGVFVIIIFIIIGCVAASNFVGPGKGWINKISQGQEESKKIILDESDSVKPEPTKPVGVTYMVEPVEKNNVIDKKVDPEEEKKRHPKDRSEEITFSSLKPALPCTDYHYEQILKNNISDPQNVILFVGYQAQHTLGRYLLEGNRRIKVFGEKYNVAAEIETINALSAHADRDGLLAYARAHLPTLQRAFVVHGEAEQADALAEGLRDLGIGDVLVPEAGETVSL